MPHHAFQSTAFLRWALPAALAAGMPLPAAAAWYAADATSLTVSSSANGPYDERRHSGGAAGSVSTESGLSHGAGSRIMDAGAQGAASAQAGGVHVVATAHARLTEPQYNYQPVVAGSATARASFEDMLVLGAPGVASGTQALLTFRIDVGGQQDIEGLNSWNLGWTGVSRWSVFAAVGLTTLSQFSEVLWTAGGQTRSGTGRFGSIELTAPVVLGTPTGVQISGEAGAAANLGAPGSEPGSAYLDAVSDLSHTVGWGGIVSLTTTDGTAITGYTALGASGFDYRTAYAAAVPEPRSVVLLGSGLALLLGVLARRSLRPDPRPATDPA